MEIDWYYNNFIWGIRSNIEKEKRNNVWDSIKKQKIWILWWLKMILLRQSDIEIVVISNIRIFYNHFLCVTSHHKPYIEQGWWRSGNFHMGILKTFFERSLKNRFWSIGKFSRNVFRTFANPVSIIKTTLWEIWKSKYKKSIF